MVRWVMENVCILRIGNATGIQNLQNLTFESQFLSQKYFFYFIVTIVIVTPSINGINAKTLELEALSYNYAQFLSISR